MKVWNIILGMALGMMLVGCYEEADWLGDNTTTEGKNFPVIADFSSRNGTEFQGNELVDLDLRFWSDDPIAEIQLLERIDGAETVVQTFGYTPNFNANSQNDQLVMSYTVPPVQEETEIILAIRIVNENGLSRETPDPGESTGSGTVNAIAITAIP